MKLHQFAMAGAAFMLLQALSAQDLAALLADKTSGTVELPAGSYQAGNVTIPSGVTLSVPNGAILNVPKDQTLTINGALTAGVYKIFEGEGKVTGALENAYVYPQWFGAVGDGKTPSGVALQKAADLAQTSMSRTLFIPQGRYLYNSTIFFRCNIEARGVLVRSIKVDPSKPIDRYKTWMPYFFPTDVAYVNFSNDTDGYMLDPNYFYGIKRDDLKVKSFEDIPVVGNPDQKVNLIEGGTLIFTSEDYFTSRNNNKGDEYYTPTDVCKLVSSKGDVFPEFCFNYADRSDAPAWDANKVYKKGECVKVNGKIFKATYVSGPGTSYTSAHLGKVDIGPMSPESCTPSGLRYSKKFKYANGVDDSIVLWVEVKMVVRYVPKQVPLTVNNLTIEIENGMNDRIYRPVYTGAFSCHRSNVTFNRLSISVKSPYIMLSSLASIAHAVDVTLNYSTFSGATFHGLGYNISQSNTANLVLNHCTSTNSRDGFAGRHGKNVTINGGYYNRIDDHYGRGYKINNVDIQCVSTYVPGYVSPKCDLQNWSFQPATPLAFAGGDVTVENCRFHNPPSLLSVRSDVGDMFGTVAIRNCTVLSDKDVGIFSQWQSSSGRTFDFTHKLEGPDQLIIENMTMNGKGRFSLAVMYPQERFRIMMRNIQPLGAINVKDSDLRIIDSTLKNFEIYSGGGLNLYLHNNIFEGTAKAMPENIKFRGSSNVVAKGAKVPFIINK